MAPSLKLLRPFVVIVLFVLMVPVTLLLAMDGIRATILAGAFPAAVMMTFALRRVQGRGHGFSLLTILRIVSAIYILHAFRVSALEDKVTSQETLLNSLLLILLVWLGVLPLLAKVGRSPVSREGLLHPPPARDFPCVTAAAILTQMVLGVRVSLSLLTSVCTPTIHLDWFLLPADCSDVYKNRTMAWEYVASVLCLVYTGLLALVALFRLATAPPRLPPQVPPQPPGKAEAVVSMATGELRQLGGFFLGPRGLLKGGCAALTFLLPLLWFLGSGTRCKVTVRLATPPNTLPRLYEASGHLPYCQHNFSSLEVPLGGGPAWAESISQALGGGATLRGGAWEPSNCRPWQRVAIIVPYRDRERQLVQLLATLHPFLQRQLVSYRIFVVEQAGRGVFNRGKVKDAGFLEAERRGPFHCYIFHDVDMLPERQDNLYLCDGSRPRHLCPALDEMRYRLYFNSLLGGVVAMTGPQFRQANGYATLYWGWGGEDDDLSARIQALGMTITQPPGVMGRCKMQRHVKDNPSTFAKPLFHTWRSRWRQDGLSNPELMRYSLVSEKEHALYTHLLVEVGQPPPSMETWLQGTPVTSLWMDEFYHC